METTTMNEAASTPTIAEATDHLENALASLCNLSDLLRALASSVSAIQGPALYPVLEALDAARQDADAAFAVVFPVLCAARRKVAS